MFNFKKFLASVFATRTNIKRSPPPSELRSRLNVEQLESRDQPSMTVTALGNTSEGGAPAPFSVVRQNTGYAEPILILTDGSTATFLSDFETANADLQKIVGSLDFAVGQSSALVWIIPIDDALVEDTETIILTVLSPTEGNASDTMLLFDNDGVSPPLPTVEITSKQDATEGGLPGNFVLTVGPDGAGPLPQPLTIHFTFPYSGLSGEATPGSDYTVPGSFITVSSFGEHFVYIEAYADGIVEDPDETVTLTISSDPLEPDTYTVGTGGLGGSDFITIIDEPAPPPRPGGTGDGLFGRYYLGKDFAEVKETRVDATVNFIDWGLGTPFPSIGTDEFSVRWTGKVQPRYTGNYTFPITVDDGVRLWVNGEKLTDEWFDHPNTPIPGNEIALEAGKLYDIRLEYHENKGAAAIKLEWQSDLQGREVIPMNRLYSNTSTIGDRVWLDADGNGRQDDGEAGVAHVGVRIVGANSQEAVPATTTNGKGTYSFVVPAEESYTLQFLPDPTRYEFTTPLVGDPALDSNARNSGPLLGRTALFASPAAGGSDLTRDAGLKLLPLVLDLDVNANNSLGDAVDLAVNYLPGYEGNVQMVSKGTSFNQVGTNDTYAGQRMKLILDGLGTDTERITRIEFEIQYSSTEPGYASNRSSGVVEGKNHTEDYSFYPDRDVDSISINGVSVEQPGIGGPIGGKMEATKTWVNFYCKDYGGASRVAARIYNLDANGKEVLGRTLRLDVPKDDDHDGLADKWEEAMFDHWNNQYQEIGAFDLKFFGSNPNEDNEQKNPDGAVSLHLVDQRGEGDAHTVLEEYRGYILDGGGLDRAGANGHAGGHIRLDPARKEVLLEVDKGTVLNNLPAGGLPAMLNGAASVFSNAQRGAGIYVYWLMDQTLPIPKADVDTRVEIVRKLDTTRNVQLQRDFLHILIFDEGLAAAFDAKNKTVGSVAATASYGKPLPAEARGVAWATTDAIQAYTPANFPKTVEAYASALAHEITHMLIEKRNGGFDQEEHTIDPDTTDPPGGPLDLACLMLRKVGAQGGATRANREFATVMFFPVVQAEIDTGKAEGLVP